MSIQSGDDLTKTTLASENIGLPALTLSECFTEVCMATRTLKTRLDSQVPLEGSFLS